MSKSSTVTTIKSLIAERISDGQTRVAGKAYVGQQLSSIGIFFGAITMLIFYLLSLRFEVDLPVSLFFVSIVLIVLSLLYQIFFIDLSKGIAGSVIVEITLAAIVFHYIYQIPTYGIYGTDAYLDLASMQAILESGRIAGVPEYTQITSFFPVIHIIGAQLSLITGIDYYNIAKWFPPIIGSITIPMIYLLVRLLFKQEKAALLAAFLFACIQHYVMFESLFVRETIGLVLAISTIYFLVISWSSGHPLIYRALAILCLGGTIIAHHLTSVMLLLLLLIYWLFKMPAKFFSGETRLTDNYASQGMTLSFLLIGVVGTLLWWLTNVTQPVQIGMNFLNNLINPGSWGLRTIFNQDTMGIASLPNLRYYFLVYGSYVCYFLFGLILIYKSFSQRGTVRIETPVFMVYIMVCGILGFLSYFVLTATIGGDRFLAFGWLFAFGPLALAITEFRNNIVIGFSSFLILFYIFVNLFTIHPTIWNPDSPGIGGAASKEDFALAETIDFSIGDIIGYQNNIMTVYESQKKLGTDTTFLLDPIDINRYKWVIVNRAGLEEIGIYSNYTKEVVAQIKALEAGDTPDYHRLYESNNLAVLEKR